MSKRLANSFTARISMAGAIASAMLFAFPVFAQGSRLSLADRVALLEQRAQNKDQGALGMVNQMQQLQAQVRQLQGQIEELQHHLQELDDKNKAQYADIDSRLSRLETGTAGAAAPVSPQAGPDSNTPNNPAAASSTVAETNTAEPTAGTASADPAVVQAAYDVAFKALRSGAYAQASRDFRAFIQQYPDQALTPNALYWLGESYYGTTNYAVALTSFQQLLSQFPQSEKVPDAMLKVGYCQYELKQMAEAQATLTMVTTRYPGSRAANLASERLRQIHLQAAN